MKKINLVFNGFSFNLNLRAVAILMNTVRFFSSIRLIFLKNQFQYTADKITSF